MRQRNLVFFAILVIVAVGLLLPGCASKQPQVEEEPPVPDTTGQAERLARERAEQARLDSIRAVEEAERLRLEQERLAREKAEREEQEAKESLQIIHFDFDKSNLKKEAREKLQKNAEIIMKYEDWQIVVEGHCDERGSTEYNLALGERRAASTKNYYIDYGIKSERIEIISYGEERPAVQGHNEEAWAKNRRAVTRVK